MTEGDMQVFEHVKRYLLGLHVAVDHHSLWSVFIDHQRRRSGCRERRVTISALPPMPLYPPAHISQRGINLATVRQQ